MTFIHVRHDTTLGEADIPEETLTFWRAKGFEPYDAPLPEEIAEIADEASLSMKRADLDDLAALAGVFEPESLGSKQEVLDAIDDLNTNPQSSGDDTPTSEEDT